MGEGEAGTVVELSVNGARHALDVDPATPLLYVLRNDLGLTAAKFGCGLEQCGACTVLVDGQPAFSCVSPVASFAGREVTTLEGLLAGSPAARRVEEAFVAEQAAQCGYCIPGIVVAAVALLERNPAPSVAEARLALEPHLCRCGTHARILRAVLRAARTGASP